MINSKAFTEIYELFEILGDEKKRKIPTKLLEHLKKNKLNSYSVEDFRENISNGVMSEDAITLYAFLELKYLIEDPLEKEILMAIYKHNDCINDKKYFEIELNELFSNSEKEVDDKIDVENNIELMKIKEENIFQKLLKKIKKILNLKK